MSKNADASLILFAVYFLNSFLFNIFFFSFAFETIYALRQCTIKFFEYIFYRKFIQWPLSNAVFYLSCDIDSRLQTLADHIAPSSPADRLNIHLFAMARVDSGFKRSPHSKD